LPTETFEKYFEQHISDYSSDFDFFEQQKRTVNVDIIKT